MKCSLKVVRVNLSLITNRVPLIVYFKTGLYTYSRRTRLGLSPGGQHSFTTNACLLQFSSIDTNITAANSTADVLIKGTRFHVNPGYGGWWIPDASTTGNEIYRTNAEHLNGKYPIKWITFADEEQKRSRKIPVTEKTLMFTEMKIRPSHFDSYS